MSRLAHVQPHDERTERILDAVAAIAPGTASSYGRVAAEVGTGPRQVGAVMAACGSEVPWWRVVHSDGSITAELLPEATRLLAAEGVVVRDGRVPRSALRETSPN